ncbi:uncharacterized protein LOC143677332 [Tamandua tetradactyla]|uniref:uncharacterized protein LOC143677332 n=1 Tax=Tamandua tetradactyla TaxID=48850 RepID=UPI004053C2BF
MSQHSARKRPFSETLDIVTEEEIAKQPTTQKSRSPDSRPSKIPRVSERSSSSTSTEKPSNSSDYQSGSPSGHQWVRCAYFTRVHTVKGVAVEWQTKSTFSPVGNAHPQVFEAELSEESTTGSLPSLTNTESMLSSPEPFQEQPEIPIPEPVVHLEEEEERARAATPEWLVTTELGFRCVACCRVFLTREAFLVHAEHGVKEGFSCRAFYEDVLERQRPHSERRPRRQCLQMAHHCMKANVKKKIKVKEEICRRLQEKMEEQKQKLLQLQQELVRLQSQEAQQKKRRAAHPQGQRGKRLKTHRKTH